MAGDDWREAIRQYDADVASGAIAFSSSPGDEFAVSYPGMAEEEAGLAEWLGSHLPGITG